MKKILIIDDNPENNEIYIDQLKTKYDTSVAMHLETAERLVKRKEFDMIIIDVMMPTQNLNTNNEMETGYKFYEEKIMPTNNNAKILFWTRLTDDSFKTFNERYDGRLYYAHKESAEKHLLEKVNSII